jgi:hypothetical protein
MEGAATTLKRLLLATPSTHVKLFEDEVSSFGVPSSVVADCCECIQHPSLVDGRCTHSKCGMTTGALGDTGHSRTYGKSGC